MSMENENLTPKQRLFLKLFGEGLEILQRQLNITELQQKYNAYYSQVLMIEVADVGLPPIYLQVKDGKILRSFKFDGKPDAYIRFRTLDGLLNILDGSISLDDIFCWDGIVMVDGKMVKEVDFDGDFYRGSIILKDVADTYLSIIRNILKQQMKTVGYATKVFAKIKKAFNRDPNLDCI